MELHTVAWFVYKGYPYKYMNWQNKTDVIEMYNRFLPPVFILGLCGVAWVHSDREV